MPVGGHSVLHFGFPGPYISLYLTNTYRIVCGCFTAPPGVFVHFVEVYKDNFSFTCLSGTQY